MDLVRPIDCMAVNKCKGSPKGNMRKDHDQGLSSSGSMHGCFASTAILLCFMSHFVIGAKAQTCTFEQTKD